MKYLLLTAGGKYIAIPPHTLADHQKPAAILFDGLDLALMQGCLEQGDVRQVAASLEGLASRLQGYPAEPDVSLLEIRGELALAKSACESLQKRLDEAEAELANRAARIDSLHETLTQRHKSLEEAGLQLLGMTRQRDNMRIKADEIRSYLEKALSEGAQLKNELATAYQQRDDARKELRSAQLRDTRPADEAPATADAETLAWIRVNGGALHGLMELWRQLRNLHDDMSGGQRDPAVPYPVAVVQTVLHLLTSNPQVPRPGTGGEGEAKAQDAGLNPLLDNSQAMLNGLTPREQD